MVSLIKSTVYQRYTWGISDPVVGMILSEAGCIGRVVMDWTDETSDPDYALVSCFFFVTGNILKGIPEAPNKDCILRRTLSRLFSGNL